VDGFHFPYILVLYGGDESFKILFKCMNILVKNLRNIGGIILDLKKNTVLIVVIIILAGTLSFAFGYMYLSTPKAANTTANVTTINQTMQNGTTIPYSSEYITFTKAKSIAKSDASKGVTVSDPILIKDKNGQAVYVCNYYYKGSVVGGIIINAKNGAVIYKELNIPTNLNTDTSNTNNYNYNDQNTNYNDNSDYDNSNYDDSNYDNNYDNSNYDSSDSGSNDNSGYDNSYSDDSN
jgi:hypothetical protein